MDKYKDLIAFYKNINVDVPEGANPFVIESLLYQIVNKNTKLQAKPIIKNIIDMLKKELVIMIDDEYSADDFIDVTILLKRYNSQYERLSK